MIRWVLSVLASILMWLLVRPLALILPMFARVRNGWTLNHSLMMPEPRLPKWLSWFDCEDNSLWGDGGWRTEHCPYYKSYFGMVRWLWRNGGHNFNYNVLGCKTGLVEKASPYFSHNENGFWLYREFIPVRGKYLELYFGWNLSGAPDEQCKVVSQIRWRTQAN